MKLSELIVYSLFATFIGALLFGSSGCVMQGEIDSPSRVSVTGASKPSFTAFAGVVDGVDAYVVDSKYTCLGGEIVERGTQYLYYGDDNVVDECNPNLVAIVKNKNAIIKVIE